MARGLYAQGAAAFEKGDRAAAKKAWGMAKIYAKDSNDPALVLCQQGLAKIGQVCLTKKEPVWEDTMCAVRQEELLYRSDFTVPAKDWDETATERYKVYRRDGNMHIGANPPLAVLRCVPVSIGDFRFCVDAGFVTTRGICGIVFRVKDYNVNGSFYALAIQECSYAIYMCSCRSQWDCIADCCDSDLIKPAPQINAWAVEMAGDKIAVEVNGHALARVSDSRLGFGAVGVYVSALKEYAEARFRDVCLYAIEYQEDSAMVLPAPPQQ